MPLVTASLGTSEVPTPLGLRRVGERNRVGLLPGLGLRPFVKVIDRHETAAALQRLAERRLGFDAFGFGVDVGEANF